MLTLWSIILFCVILFLIILLGLYMLHVYWTFCIDLRFLKKKSLRMQIFSILLYPCNRLKYEDIVKNNSKMSL